MRFRDGKSRDTSHHNGNQNRLGGGERYPSRISAEQPSRIGNAPVGL